MAWMSLQKWLKRRSATRELFVHEDDWGQIEMLPSACATWCEAEFARIADFSAAHRDPHGNGWSDIYVRPSPPRTLADLAIPFDDAVTALAQRLLAFEQVVSGTFSSPQPVARVRACGPNPNTGLVLSPDGADAIVETITFVLNGTEAACEEVRRAAAAVPAAEPAILVNWTAGSLMQL